MTILIITPRIPYPPFRGDKLKIYNLSKHLAKNNSVKILTFLRNKNQSKDLRKLEQLGIQVETVKFSIFRSILNFVIAIFSNIPFQVAWFKSDNMRKKISYELSNKKYDVVYYHLIRSAQYLDKNFTDNLSVLDFTDAVSLYLSRLSIIEKNVVKKLFIKIEEKRVRAYEKIAENFNTVYICSEVDRKYLEGKGFNHKIKILNNGIDINYFKSAEVKPEMDRIIFTGNMPYYANYDAALYFAKEIFPIVLSQIPSAKFYIVGQNPPYKIKALSSKNIFVTGFVPDIKQEYLKSTVNIAPMRFGAGTLNKVIESIALGIPVVATSQAVDGLQESIKRFVFIADSPEEFANYVVKILRKPFVYNQFLNEGQLMIKERLNWEKVVEQFEKDIKEDIVKLKR